MEWAMQNGAPDKANVIAPPPLIYGAAFIVGWLIHRVFPVPVLPETVADWIGVGLVLVSFPIAITAFRAMSRAQTSFDPRKPTTAIVTEGPYCYSRNPMYVSLTLLYLGVALLINALWIVLFVVPLLIVMQRGVIAREEGYLERKFGEVYLNYKAQVRCWI